MKLTAKRECYVYAVGIDGDWGGLERAVKIGVAHNPHSRLNGIQTGCPAKVSILKTWVFDDEAEARGFEVACHKEFRESRSIREWFFVSIEDIEEFHDIYVRHSADLDSVCDYNNSLSKFMALAKIVGHPESSKAAKEQSPTNVMKLPPLPSVMLTTLDAAKYLGVSASWLNKSRMTGTGPVYLKLGGSVRYKVKDLDDWISSKERTAVYDHAQRKRA